jgi:hypothetical protein
MSAIPTSHSSVINLSLGLDHYEPQFEEVLRLVLQYDVVPVVADGVFQIKVAHDILKDSYSPPG